MKKGIKDKQEKTKGPFKLCGNLIFFRYYVGLLDLLCIEYRGSGKEREREREK